MLQTETAPKSEDKLKLVEVPLFNLKYSVFSCTSAFMEIIQHFLSASNRNTMS